METSAKLRGRRLRKENRNTQDQDKKCGANCDQRRHILQRLNIPLLQRAPARQHTSAC